MLNFYKVKIVIVIALVGGTLLSTNISCSKANSNEVEVVPQPEVSPEQKADAVVAKDGTGKFSSVQEAIGAAPANRTTPYVIYIKNGSYKEIITVETNKKNIHLIGENAEKTILTFDNFASKLDPSGKEYGTSGSASTFIKGNDFLAENVTFENSSGPKGQALAINISALRSAFKNCRFLGYQDTWYAANATLQYMKDCYLEGTVDFMFGGSTALFENCTLHSVNDGYLTAASTPKGQKYGYVYLSCKLTGAEGVKAYLGRPWRPDAQVVFISSDMGKHIRPEGWHNWGDAANEKTAFYAEYKSTGSFESGKRVSWSHQLTDQERENYTREKILGSWDPFK